MATNTNYDINYNDKRFQEVKNQEATALKETQGNYDQMINQTDSFYQEQIDASKDWANKQTELQQAQTDFTIEKVEQQKEQAKKDYTKEQKGAYADYQKATNQFGANAEKVASQGLQESGYSESTRTNMYNTYQNRYMAAKDSYTKAILNYDNSIKEAQLANSSALATIAYEALQQQLELSLKGFEYKNTLVLQKLEAINADKDRYYQRYQDVLKQINTENALAEQIRQYNETLAEEKRQHNETLAENKRQHNETLAEDKRQYNTSLAENKRQYNTTLAENQRQHNESMSLQRDKLAEDKRQYNESLAFQKSKASQDQSNWEKEYALAQKKSSVSSSSSSSSSNKSSSKLTNGSSSNKTSSSSNKLSSSSSSNKSSSSSSSKNGTVDENGVYTPMFGGKSSTTVKLSNGHTGYTSATTAYQVKGGKSPYSESYLADQGVKRGLVTKVTYNGKTYYY